MLRVFKDMAFARAAPKAKLSDTTLVRAANEVNDGLVDAFLGGELVKKRVPRPGGGKRGGYRTILVFRKADRAFFVHIFAKNDEANVDESDLADLKVYARILLGLDDRQLATAVKAGKLTEITNE